MVIHACNAEWLSLKMRTHINIRQGWQDTPTSIQFNALRAKIDWHRRYTEARQSKASNKCRCPPAADRTRKRRCHRRTATLRSYLHGGNRRRNEFLWALVARPLRRYHRFGFIQRRGKALRCGALLVKAELEEHGSDAMMVIEVGLIDLWW